MVNQLSHLIHGKHPDKVQLSVSEFGYQASYIV